MHYLASCHEKIKKLNTHVNVWNPSITLLVYKCLNRQPPRQYQRHLAQSHHNLVGHTGTCMEIAWWFMLWTHFFFLVGVWETLRKWGQNIVRNGGRNGGKISSEMAPKYRQKWR